jgi:uncharacterized protein YcbK (DUF882 family)
LSETTQSVGRPNAEIHIICGYRAPESNEYLRTHTSGVAKNSLHMQAEAIDIRLPGTSTSTFRNAALALKLGGSGIIQLQISFMWTSAGFATGSRSFVFLETVSPTTTL